METDAIELDLKGTLYDGQLLASPTLMVVTINDKAATVDAFCDTFVSLRPDTTSRGDELYEGMGARCAAGRLVGDAMRTGAARDCWVATIFYTYIPL